MNGPAASWLSQYTVLFLSKRQPGVCKCVLPSSKTQVSTFFRLQKHFSFNVVMAFYSMTDTAESSSSTAATTALESGVTPEVSAHATTKTALVSFHERKRPVVFVGGLEELHQKALQKFSDILLQGLSSRI